MKVKHKTWNGKMVVETVGDAVQRAIGQSGGHGYGQIEQIEAELRETQRFLYRLCDIMAEVMTPEDVCRLLGRSPEGPHHDDLEVAEGFCCYCQEEAEGGYSIHRDGLGEGPELPLCNACGSNETPTCEEIWEKLAKDRE